MLTNKDIRVENGNLVLNGDKYPLDGQSPAAIMAIVEDNSDSTPTAESTAPVTSAGIKTYVDTAIGDLTQTGVTGDSVADQILDLNSTLGYKNSITLGSGAPIITFTKSGDVVGFYATLTNLEEGVITIGTLPERFLPLFKYNIYPFFSINSPYESQDASLWIDDLGVVKLYKASGVTSGYLSGTYLAKNRGNA